MLKFVKMHGIGNDYVYLDAVGDPSLDQRADLPELARRISDRHRGVGSDGLILVCKPVGPKAHVRMRMFNSDGSESEMCGNGVRCVAKFAHDRLGITANPMLVETGRGVLPISYETKGGKLSTATVDMGEPILDFPAIPVDEREVSFRGAFDLCGIETGPTKEDMWVAALVSMGNPHAVMFDYENDQLKGDGLRMLDIRRVGPKVERFAAFPNRINAHFVNVQSRSEAAMRTWERGAGETMACGTGACAVAVAGVRTGLLDRKVLLRLPGGDLRIEWDERTGHVLMTGPATDVFEGVWSEGAGGAG